MPTRKNLKPTKRIIKTELGPERVYKGPRGGKYIVIGNKVKPLRKK